MTKTIDQIDELIQTKTAFRRHSKGPVMFSGCSPLGDVIIIDNISPSKSYDLTGWYIERETDSHSTVRYDFPDHYILPPMTTVELWSTAGSPTTTLSDNELHQSSGSQTIVRTTVKLLTWSTARQWSVNRLFDYYGRQKAHFSHRTLTPEEQEDQ